MNTVEINLKNDKCLNIDISPGDIVIDCGANVGKISQLFAEKGAIVLAFEPNKWAFEELSKRFKNNKNVNCVNSAVSIEDGTAKLYMHKLSTTDPVKYSKSSTLVCEKQNLNLSDHHIVQVVDLARVIRETKEKYRKNISILKIDIEGAECEVMQKLMDEEILNDIPYVFVETHESKISSLRTKTQKMIERAKKKKLKNVNFNWI